MKALQSYAGRMDELSLPEQFLLVMSGVPRLHDKIHLLILVRQFEVRGSASPVLAKRNKRLYVLTSMCIEAKCVLLHCPGYR